MLAVQGHHLEDLNTDAWIPSTEMHSGLGTV